MNAASSHTKIFFAILFFSYTRSDTAADGYESADGNASDADAADGYESDADGNAANGRSTRLASGGRISIILLSIVESEVAEEPIIWFIASEIALKCSSPSFQARQWMKVF